MSGFNFPIPIPTVIPTDTNIRASKVSTIYPTQVLGPYTTWKLPVRVATTSNIILSGLQTIDGITVKSGDRVLVKNQTTASENGIYVVFSSASATDFWIRANDLQAGSNAANVSVFVNEGTINADLMYICTNNSGSDIVGTNNLVFVTYGNVSSIVPGGNNSNIQYNNTGTFGGSSLFTFNPTAYNYNISYPVKGTVTLGSTNPASLESGRITSPNATALSGDSGTGLIITTGNGDGIGNGGNFTLFTGSSTSGNGGDIAITSGNGINGGLLQLYAGSGTTNGGDIEFLSGDSVGGTAGVIRIRGADGALGQGGNVIITSGFAPNQSGDIELIADSSGTEVGVIKLTTNNILTTFIQGGVQFTKDTSGAMTIANLVGPQSVTTISRQGIITITDPSAVLAGASVTITVNNINILANDTVYVCVQEFNTSANGIPLVLVSSVTTSTSFSIQLYNIGGIPFTNSQMKISFQML